MRISSMSLAAAAIAALSVPAAALAQIELVPVVSGLSSPVFVGHAGDHLNRLFIVEQAGVIKVLQPGATVPTTFSIFAPGFSPAESADCWDWPSTRNT